MVSSVLPPVLPIITAARKVRLVLQRLREFGRVEARNVEARVAWRKRASSATVYHSSSLRLALETPCTTALPYLSAAMANVVLPAPSGAVAPALGPVPLRRLRNPFVALTDDIDSASEETKPPTKLKGMLYVLLTPFLGLGICMLGFPVLWWNERRAAGYRGKKPVAPVVPATGTMGQGTRRVVWWFVKS
eukprot:Skav222712  [mRNA]  locus=scaffold1661:290226:298732:- [translate_table: standard]